MPPELARDEVLGGRYRVVDVLGRGGYGVVYDCRHVATGHSVAVKVLATDMAGHRDEMAQRFVQEAATTSRLTHPNTVRVFDFGELDGGDLFLAMERLEGRTLREVLALHARADLPMGLDQICELGVAVLRSLGEAHALGLVHRDLKPANIFLHEVAGGDSVIKVLDFGIAKHRDHSLTQAGQALGTPTHMAPEQITGDPVDGRTDLYQLGVVLFECLVGRLPYEAEQPLQLAMAHATAPIPSIVEWTAGQVPADVAAVVERALAKRAEERWPDALAMRRALESVAPRPVTGLFPLADLPALAERYGGEAVPDAPVETTRRSRAVPAAAAATPGSRGYAVADGDAFEAEEAAPLAEGHDTVLDEPTPVGRGTMPVAAVRPVASAPAGPRPRQQTPRWPTAPGVPVAAWLQTLDEPPRSAPGQSRLTTWWLAPNAQTVVLGDHRGEVRLVDLGVVGAQPASVLGCRLDLVIGSHDGPVLAVVGCDDGRWLASGSVGGELVVWDPGTAGPAGRLQLDAGVSSLAFSGDGRLLVAGLDDGTVSLVEVPSLRLRRVLAGHDGAVTAVAAAGSRTLVASAGEDGVVRAWDPVGGGARSTHAVHEGAVAALALTADGSWIGSGGWDCRAVWRPTAGGPSIVSDAHRDIVAGIALDPARGLVATAGDDRRACVHGLRDGALIVSRDDFAAGAKGVRFSADGAALVGSWDGTFRRVEVG